jgi:hypothetical protein
MTLGDNSFLREIGIEPCDLDEVGVLWEDETEPGFISPGTPLECLTRYHRSIRQAVWDVAKELEITLPDGGLDDLTQKITQMFLDFVAADLEDVVALYPFHQSLRPRGFTFPDYMKFWVKACVKTMLQNRMTRTKNSNGSLRQKSNKDDEQR